MVAIQMTVAAVHCAGNSMLSLNGAREPGTPRGRDPLQRTWSGNNASLALSGVSSGLTERCAWELFLLRFVAV